MPEGDTVWNTAKLLTDALAGEKVEHSQFRVPQLATVDLSGAVIRECASRGKHLLLRMRQEDCSMPDVTLHSHLRMDGSWRVFAPGQRWYGGASHTIRAVLRCSGGVAVGYHLHELALVATDAEHRLIGHLGPDLLGRPGTPGGWDLAEAVQRLCRAPERAIGLALLDQTCVAGIGNLYRCEVLFLHGIHPTQPVGTVDSLAAVLETAHELLLANLGRWTQSTTGSLRKGEQVYVYGRHRELCRRCGGGIRRAELDGRAVFWCPHCQPRISADGEG